MSTFRLSIDLKNVCALFLRIRSPPGLLQLLGGANNNDISHCSVRTAALPWSFRPPGLLSLLDKRPGLSSPRLGAAAPAPPPAPAATSASPPAKHPEQAAARAD